MLLTRVSASLVLHGVGLEAEGHRLGEVGLVLSLICHHTPISISILNILIFLSLQN